MKFSLALMALLLATTVSKAGWIDLDESKSSAIGDKKTVLIGDTAIFWLRVKSTNIFTPFKSVLTQVAANCGNQEYLTLRVLSFDDYFAKGNLITSEERPSEVKTARDNSVMQMAITNACAKGAEDKPQDLINSSDFKSELGELGQGNIY